MLSLRELIAEFDVQVLAGEQALDMPVRSVHTSELSDPTPWLSGGEVLLSTGMLLDSEERQREFVTRLAERQITGLGFGVGFNHAEVPPTIVAAATEHGLPVFAVPFELPFIAITETAFARLASEHYTTLRRALQAQERLERVVLSERGLEALIATLSALVGSSVLVYDGRGETLAVHRLGRQLSELEQRQVHEAVLTHIERRDAQPFMPGLEDPSRALAVPVIADGSRAGTGTGAVAAPEAWLVTVKHDGPLAEFDRLAVRQSATIVALELLRERVAGDTERRLAGDLLAGLLAGELSGSDLQRRLEPFGIHDQVSALVLAQPNGGTTAAQAEQLLLGALRAEATPGLVASDGKLLSALIPGIEEQSLFGLADRLAGRIASEVPHEPIVLGVGRPVGAADARRAYHEARCTLEALTLGVEHEPHRGVSVAAVPAPRVATYRDLGSFQLLLSLQDDEALKLYCDSVLGPIESSEGYYGGELMRSLEAFIEENGQWERAAKRLYCHRHTLRYRIKRVEELTGRDLSSARDRIEFWLALRGRELFV